jgi:hypothetical protein
MRVSPHSIVMEHPRMSSCQSTPAPAPLAPSRHIPCHTPRTHATGLWVASNTTWCPPEICTKFGISERRGPAPHLRRLQPGAPHSGFGTYLAMQAVSLPYLEHRTA